MQVSKPKTSCSSWYSIINDTTGSDLKQLTHLTACDMFRLDVLSLRPRYMAIWITQTDARAHVTDAAGARGGAAMTYRIDAAHQKRGLDVDDLCLVDAGVTEDGEGQVDLGSHQPRLAARVLHAALARQLLRHPAHTNTQTRQSRVTSYYELPLYMYARVHCALKAM